MHTSYDASDTPRQNAPSDINTLRSVTSAIRRSRTIDGQAEARDLERDSSAVQLRTFVPASTPTCAGHRATHAGRPRTGLGRLDAGWSAVIPLGDLGGLVRRAAGRGRDEQRAAINRVRQNMKVLQRWSISSDNNAVSNIINEERCFYFYRLARVRICFGSKQVLV